MNPREPSILQLMYDSLADIKAATEAIARQQTEDRVLLERQSGDIRQLRMTVDQYERERKDQVDKFDKLTERVSSLQRIGWVAGIVGAASIAVITGVATETINHAIAGEKTPTAVQTTAQPK